MASNKIEDAHPVLRNAFSLAKAKWADLHPSGPKIIITQSYRPVAEQNKLYAQGRTTKGQIVTNAKGGQSAHNYNPSYAIDVAFVKADGNIDWSDHWYKEFAPLMKEHVGITWGGDFKSITDYPHYEVTGWKALKDKK